MIMVNTQISYMYRDASNYKQATTVIFPGTLEDKQSLLNLEDFVPSAVGLEDLQHRFGPWTEDDHPYHEITEITETDLPPTENMSAEDFSKMCREADWDKIASEVTQSHGN